jgi:broad specificity phosphatase PhoE
MELVCVRHGRTTWNADLRFQGQTDIPLDGHGRGQAMLLAAHLRSQRFDAAVSSDLRRCVETARIILSEHSGVELRLDPDLREMAFGEWEGLTWAQIVKKYPQLGLDGWSRPKSQVPPGGERFEEVITRVRRAIGRLRSQKLDGRVLLVTHAGVLHALLPIILGEEAAEKIEIRFTPAGISRFSLDPGGGGRILALNEEVEAPRLER